MARTRQQRAVTAEERTFAQPVQAEETQKQKPLLKFSLPKILDFVWKIIILLLVTGDFAATKVQEWIVEQLPEVIQIVRTSSLFIVAISCVGMFGCVYALAHIWRVWHDKKITGNWSKVFAAVIILVELAACWGIGARCIPAKGTASGEYVAVLVCVTLLLLFLLIYVTLLSYAKLQGDTVLCFGELHAKIMVENKKWIYVGAMGILVIAMIFCAALGFSATPTWEVGSSSTLTTEQVTSSAAE